MSTNMIVHMSAHMGTCSRTCLGKCLSLMATPVEYVSPPAEYVAPPACSKPAIFLDFPELCVTDQTRKQHYCQTELLLLSCLKDTIDILSTFVGPLVGLKTIKVSLVTVLYYDHHCLKYFRNLNIGESKQIMYLTLQCNFKENRNMNLFKKKRKSSH